MVFSFIFCTFVRYKLKIMPKKILFINQEISPYTQENDLSILGREIPQKVQDAGYEIRIFMPKWGNINERRHQLHDVQRLSGMNLVIDDTDHPLLIKVASIPTTRMQIYFIDNDDYFSKRQMTEDNSGEEYPDNGERAIFFARGVLETVKKLRWTPDLVVCQGWISAVVPLYVKTAYHDEPSFANVKVATVLYQDQLKNELGEKFKKCLEFKQVSANVLKNYKKNFDIIELGKLAVDYSDAIIEGSEHINEKLKDYASKKKLPTLAFQGSDFINSFSTFIENLI